MNLRSHATSRPVLRLVGESAAATGSERLRLTNQPGRPAEESRRSQVRRENHAAAMRFDLDPNDPRWILALRAQSELQGTALTADRRQRLLTLAHRLGMRSFDANLVIAIVQDEARSGPVGSTLTERLRIIPPGAATTPAGPSPSVAAPPHRPPETPEVRPGLTMLILTVLVAAGVLALLIRWLMEA